MNWRIDRWARLLIIAVALTAYLPTLMTDISATDNSYFIDVGSNMNALAQWGTLHGSGYPLYSFTGAVFVAIFRNFMTPAAAASLYSTLWGVAALIMLYGLLVEWRRDRALALIATGVLGFSWAFWLFASYAEVYTLSAFVGILALYCALKADRTGKARYLYGLAVCVGLSVSHARAIALGLPAPLLIALPAWWGAGRRRWTLALKWTGLAAAVGLLPYVYLLIRSLQGATWIWGDPTTLDGFWRLLFGAAYTALLTWPATPAAWLELIGFVGQVWLNFISWPMALLGAAGLIGLLVRRQWRYGLALILNTLGLFIIAVAEQASFPGELMDDIPAMLIPAFVFFLLGFVFLCNDVRRSSEWAWRAGAAGGAIVCGLMIAVNQPLVSQLTGDQTGRRIITDAQQFVRDGRFASAPAFFSPWSGEFWALSYGRDVTGELTRFELLPNRADLGQAAQRHGVIHTFEHTLYNRGLDWWRRRLGEVHLSSSGVKTLAIASQPPTSEHDLPGVLSAPVPMGDAPVELLDYQVKPLEGGPWQITLYWRALRRPDRDYSVFVQASDQEVIDSPDDIVAQADTRAPVHGWYPTTLWSPGEIVRDDHLIAPPIDRVAKYVAVGLYTQNAAGQFQNFGRFTIRLPR